MVAQPKHRISEAEYLRLERASPTKNELRNGEIVAMAHSNYSHSLISGGTSFTHSLIASNANGTLFAQLSNSPCTVHSSELRVKVATARTYIYPDVMVVCEPQFEDNVFDTLLNPIVIIEVLSPATEAYDRGEKFLRYQQIESLQEYVLIAQDAYRVEHFVRQPDNRWLLGVSWGLEATIKLKTIQCELPLKAIYARVQLEIAPSATDQTNGT